MVVLLAAVLTFTLTQSSSGQTATGIQPLTPQMYANIKATSCGDYTPVLERLQEAALRQKKATQDATLQNLGSRAPVAVADIDEEFIRLQVQYEQTPFYFKISGPCGRLTSIVSRAAKRYEQPVIPPLEDLNKDGVLVHVRPSRIAQTEQQAAIERWTGLMAKPEPAIGVSPELQALLDMKETQKKPPDAYQQARPVENVIIKRADKIIRAIRQELRPLKIDNGAGASRVVNEGDFFFPYEAFDPSTDITIVIISGEMSEEWVIKKTELAQMR